MDHHPIEQAEDGIIQIEDDVDSSYGDYSDVASGTTSLYSQITSHVYENGRRYNGWRYGTYWGPNDEQASDNLDLFHHVFNLTFGGRTFLAPIGDNPQRVLDLGTGTGIWAMDFADEFPSAAVIATDVSAIQPTLVPPNLEFQIDDFCEPWTFRKESFDYIHARCIYGCSSDYPALYQEALDHLKPGGWFEQAEISVVAQSDDSSLKGTAIERWGPLAHKVGDVFGKSFRIVDEMTDMIKSAGFVNVKKRTFKWPIGTWPKDPKLKEIGLYNKLGWEEGLDGWANFLFTNYLGWTLEEVQVLTAHIRNDLRNPKVHAWQHVTVCYGQKPTAKKVKD
ncbi:UMTA [Coccidioides immitis H538.4]|uniref:UMTA n=2 Tax=Coccidioides immitis TaxID=5501 RepID=A0A0J8RFF7_COCIT|nr:hypothetical protein CIRG_01271 [Coccidioides immitis RMSCC 2394]KMU83637.1 UMTA [Coccidioides immitis H538.4]